MAGLAKCSRSFWTRVSAFLSHRTFHKQYQERDRKRQHGDHPASFPLSPKIRFAPDSPLEGTGFELVWGFPCQVVVSVYCQFFVRSGKGPFFIPSPTIRFPERAEWGQGTETLAKLGGLPLSGACVWQRLDA
jgi:hypothetical protein